MHAFLTKQDRIFKIFCWLIPFFCWIWAHRGFYFDGTILIGDAPVYLDHIKYYLDNIARGEYQMWNPFYAWGRPDDLYVRSIGEYNPFLYIILLLQAVGVSFLPAYWIYLISYYFLGVMGFACLSYRLFRREFLAWLGAVLLLMSSLGATIFNDNAVVLLFVPAVWFAYHAHGFWNKPSSRDGWGLVFWSMILAVTYIPFYFLTVFVLMTAGLGLAYYRDIIPGFKRIKSYAGTCLMNILTGAAAIALSLIPGILWFRAGGGGEYFVAWRHMNSPENHMGSLSLEAISAGGIVGNYSLSGLVSGLQNFQPGLIHVPLFLGGILAVGWMLAATRRMAVWVGTIIIILLIALTNVTPVHEFLYHYGIIFKYFRNLHYLMWLMIPLFILVMVEQFRLWEEYSQLGTSRKILATLLTIAVIIIMTLSVYSLPDITPLTWVTFFGACVYLILCLWNVLPSSGRIARVVILLLICVQPMSVYAGMARNCALDQVSVEESRFIPDFSYTRPQTAVPWVNLQYAHEIKNISDRSGLVPEIDGVFKYIGVRRSYELHQNLTHEQLAPYTQYKFIVYDRFQTIDPGNPDWDMIAAGLSNLENRVFLPAGLSPVIGMKGLMSRAKPIRGPDDGVEVIDFGINHISLRTQFSDPVFLVYNDSFHSGWRATIDSHSVDILPANMAFKGISLPAGRHLIEFRFRSLGRAIFHMVLIPFFMGMACLWIWYQINYVRTRRQEGDPA